MDGNLTFGFVSTKSNYSSGDFMPILQSYKHQDRWFSKSTEIAITVAYCTVILVGLFGNGIVCLVVGRKENLRSTKNMFIVNLSVSDITMCLISMPFTLIKLTMKNWPLGKVMCKTIPFVHMTDVFVSTATITAIAIDKYRCIVHAKKRKTTKRAVTYTIAMIWAISAALSTPVFIFSEVKAVKMIHEYVRYDICMELWPSGHFRAAYTIILVFVQYLVPLTVICSLHVRICHFLRTRLTENPISQREFERSMRAIQRHRKNMMLLTAIVVTFGITWLPLTLLNILADYDYRIFLDSNFNLGYAICHLIAMLSASANPIIYGWLNTNFREEFLNVMLCGRQTGKDTRDSTDEERSNVPMRQMISLSSRSLTSPNYNSIGSMKK